MPGLRIGRLAPDAVVKDEEMKKDFIELRKTAERMVCDGILIIFLLAYFAVTVCGHKL